MNDIAKLIKQAAVEAVQASSPMSILFGIVANTSPLKINVEQKLTLTDAQLILTNSVRNYDIEMILDGVRRTCTIQNALIIGDEVILLQMQGGQKYIVLEKVVKT